jgi:DNA-binding transcriptional ArsR family regulator
MTTKHNLTFRSGRTRDRIVDYLAKHPGATSETIAEALGITYAASASALSNMFGAGLVSRRRTGRSFAYMLKAEEAPQPKLKLVAPEDLGQLTLPIPGNVIAVPNPDVSVLERRLAELEAFKAEAIAKHPDLLPLDYEAYRPALAAFYGAAGWGNVAEDIVNGHPLTAAERNRIDGLIAAAKLFPQEAR